MEGFPKINEGECRKGEEPMQIVSGNVGKETVNYKGPPSNLIPDEIYEFLEKTKFFGRFKPPWV